MPFLLQQGNFQLSGGGPVVNGSVVLTLSNPNATIIATGAAAPSNYTFNLDANGNLPAGSLVYGNSELNPTATFYSASVWTGANGTGTLVSTAAWIVGPSAPYSGTLYPNVMVLPAVSFAGPLVIPSVNVVYSATPTFNAGAASKFYLTLTGAVTSSTLSGATKDQLLIFQITQDATGARALAWPTNVKNAQPVDPAPNAVSIQAFTFDGTNAYPIGEMTTN